MALGGGKFLVQNKVLPGSYINFVSKARAMGTLGERGTVAMLLKLPWGQENEVFTVESGDFQKNCMSIFGYAYTAPEMIYIREVFKGAKTVKLFRPGSGSKATVIIGKLTAKALHGGTRGNDIKICIEQDFDDENKYLVKTLVGEENIEVDKQEIFDIKDLKANSFVTFTGQGIPNELTAGTKLTGGTDKALTGNDYSVFLDRIESQDFNVLLYDGEDQTTKALFDSFTKRARDQEGFKISTVLFNYAKADYEGVISVKNPCNGENASELVYWVAGQTAGAELNQNLTNKVYDGELVFKTDYKKSEFITMIQSGEFAFYGEKGFVKVLEDLNTFTSFEPYKNRDFSNNQVIRVLDQIANDTARIFDAYYLGKVQNNDTGRNLFKSELIHYHEQLQGIQAITNFKAEDITIRKGDEKGDVVVDEVVEPVGAMNKLYVTVTVE